MQTARYGVHRRHRLQTTKAAEALYSALTSRGCSGNCSRLCGCFERRVIVCVCVFFLLPPRWKLMTPSQAVTR